MQGSEFHTLHRAAASRYSRRQISYQGAQHGAGPSGLVRPRLIQDYYSSLFLLSTSSSFQPLEFFPNLYTSRRPSTLSRISRL